MKKQFRNNGAIGALLDEYEKLIFELKIVIQSVTKEDLVKITGAKTKDPDCKSIQTVLAHVVNAGYNYTIVIRKNLGEQIDYKEKIIFHSIEKYQAELLKMFSFNEQLFRDYPDIKLEEYHSEKKILVCWGQLYDVEQLMEHAIVHVLRHRRQIEKFLLKLRA